MYFPFQGASLNVQNPYLKGVDLMFEDGQQEQREDEVGKSVNEDELEKSRCVSRYELTKH